MNVIVDIKSQQEFGKKLREIRERKKQSQEDVANAIGISVTYYACRDSGYFSGHG
jgi:transcriptional regulator with XRE-family HTH domain